MADTRFLKTRIEQHVCKWLGSRFPNHDFHGCRIALRSGYRFEFDAVSEDESIVAAILSNRPRTRTGGVNTGAVRKALLDMCYLLAVPGNPTRLMVFTDAKFREDMVGQARRLGDGGVLMEFCPLPPDLAREREAVLNHASQESAQPMVGREGNQ